MLEIKGLCDCKQSENSININLKLQKLMEKENFKANQDLKQNQKQRKKE